MSTERRLFYGDRRGKARVLTAGLIGIPIGIWLATGPLFAQGIPAYQAGSPPTARSLSLPSEGTAFTLSLAGTLAGWGLLLASTGRDTWDTPSEASSALTCVAIAGLMAGPSLGYFYGGCWGRGLLMTAVRVGVSLGVLAYSLNNDEEDLTGLGYAYLGVLLGTAIYECATVKSAVRKHNAAHMAQRGLTVAAAPFVLPKGAGLHVRLSF